MVVVGLGLEQQPPSAAPRMTGQLYSGTALPTLNWESPRKGGLKIACSDSPWAGDRACCGIPYCGRNNQQRSSKENSTKLILASWNICTLLDRVEAGRPERRTALIAHELGRYAIDIAALSETRFQTTAHWWKMEKATLSSGKVYQAEKEAYTALALQFEQNL